MAQDIRTQETAVIAIIISIIGGPDSATQSLVEAAIQDFVICHEAHRHLIITASKDGTLTNLPLPIAVASSLQILPGFIALSPDRNPIGFTSAWHDLFIIIFNLLCFEAITTNNIGALQKALLLFDLNKMLYFTAMVGRTAFSSLLHIVAACGLSITPLSSALPKVVSPANPSIPAVPLPKLWKLPRKISVHSYATLPVPMLPSNESTPAPSGHTRYEF